VQWGYYADHCFDALYELACVASLARLSRLSRLDTSTAPWLGGALVCLISAVVWLFHARELRTYRAGAAQAYSNTVGPLPLHYAEWSAIALALAAQLLGWSWHRVALGLAAVLGGSLAALIGWHITAPARYGARHGAPI
jgi:hypothetical protein